MPARLSRAENVPARIECSGRITGKAGSNPKVRLADNPPGTRTNGSSMSALVCIANGSVPITHRTSADSDACPPTCYWVLASGHPENHRPLGQPLAMILIILSLVGALIARYPFAAAVRSP